MSDKIREQLMDIRNSGVANMFDTVRVQREAHDCGYWESVIFIEEHRKEYVHFILTGEDSI